MSTQVFLDADPDQIWSAQRIAGQWNGWVVPVVDRQTLDSVVAATDGSETVEWDGDTAVVSEENRLSPGLDGLYTLDLGWTFWESTD